MLLAGGAGRYVVSITRVIDDEDVVHTLTNPTAGRDKDTLMAGGQLGRFDAAVSVPLSTATQAALAFLSTGLPDPALTWVKR